MNQLNSDRETSKKLPKRCIFSILNSSFIYLGLCLCLFNSPAFAIQSQSALSKEALLEMAIKAGQLDEVKSLVTDGADVNQVSSSGITPLHAAVINNKPEIVDSLIQSGANINATDITTGATPLHLAALYGRENIANLLLENGAEVDATMKFKITPLLVAAQFKQAKLIELLLNHKANIAHSDQEGYTALHFAAQNGDQAAVKMLIDHGADVHARDKTRNATPLTIATEQNQTVVIKMLTDLEGQGSSP